LDLEEIKFENFNISENNIISVELAKVLRYLVWRVRIGQLQFQLMKIEMKPCSITGIRMIF
jgi:hypothetical protein